VRIGDGVRRPRQSSPSGGVLPQSGGLRPRAHRSVRSDWAIPLTHVRRRGPLLVVALRRRRGGRRRMFLTIDRYGAGSTATACWT
jgi:hypothetical protein